MNCFLSITIFSYLLPCFISSNFRYIYFYENSWKLKNTYRLSRYALFWKWSHKKRADILTNEELNKTNEEPDGDTNAADFESKVFDCTAAFSPWEKDDWIVVLYNDLWYPGVVTDVRASLTLQGLFLENRRNWKLFTAFVSFHWNYNLSRKVCFSLLILLHWDLRTSQATAFFKKSWFN